MTTPTNRFFPISLLAIFGLLTGGLRASSDESIQVQETRAAMRKAAEFYCEHAATHGGYVYFYTLDFSQRWGEGLARNDQIWVQPPGTPTVGMALLEAYRATEDPYYLDAARDAAEALVFGQLQSGGWSNSIDLALRSEGVRYQGGDRRREATTSLDDGQTQSAIQFLVRVDQALNFEHQEIHEAVKYALDALLAAQFSNGGFPQGWKSTPVPAHPALKASYPTYDWRTEGRIKNYWDMYTLNDDVCGYVADALIDAYEVYDDEQYLAALRRLGDFLILAQMPDPQPGWAQQYNPEMKPIWARKFEPPAIAGDESQEVLETLLRIHQTTGDAKYLEPIPPALAWLEESKLPDGKLARYYELQTNRPLYMQRHGDQYTLTYDDSQLPSHYGWKIEPRWDSIRSEYALRLRGEKTAEDPGTLDQLRIQAREIIGTLDDQGRWISIYEGEPLVGQAKFPLKTPYLSSEVFSDNLTTLSKYVTAASPAKLSTTSAPPTPSAMRKWSDRSGQFSVDAEFVSRDGANVRLRRQDGSVISVLVERLSDTDQRYLSSLEPPTVNEGHLVLVRDGKATSVIVTNGRPNEAQALAAVELQEHLRIMSGATIPIVKENELPADAPQTRILVGPSNLVRQQGIDTSELDAESFLVKTTKDSLILVGEDRTGSNPRMGTLWAVYDFLQDQLGCRWIWPGEIGRVVPQRSTVTVGDLDTQETPTIKIRGFRMAAQDKHRIAYEKEGLGKFLEFGETFDRVSEDERVWLRRMRMGRSFKLSYGHAFTDWWEKYQDTNPGIFALQPNGQRGPRKSSQPDFVKMCVSNPELWKLQLGSLHKYAAQGARGLWINACENDGSGGFCVCSRCRAWDADPNRGIDSLPLIEDGSDVDSRGSEAELPESLSDRYARWYNELARRAREVDPEARIIAYAYSRYREPPLKLDRLEPNIWIGYVGFNAYPRPEAYRKQSVDEWFGWSSRGATVFLRSNSMFYCGEGAPYVVTRQLVEDLHFQVENGLRAVDFDNLQGYWATTGPSYYTLARMLWDTDADPNQVLDEFYDSFGPMKSIVRQYFDYWEKYTEALGNNPKFMELRRAERLQAYSTIYNNGVLTDAEKTLAQAQHLLPQATEAERERFRNIELGLQHGRLLAQALQDGKTSNGPEGESLMAFRRRIAERNVINVYWTTSKEMRYRVFE